MQDWDFLIIGQGLAGTSLAWALHWRGASVLVIDAEEDVTSSKIAAGLITPVTGQRLMPSWRMGDLYPTAAEFYGRVEALTGRQFFHPAKMVRLLANELEQSRWQARQNEGSLVPFLSEPQPSPLVDPAAMHQEFGGFEMQPAARLDVAAYLEASRKFFSAKDCYRAARISPHEIVPEKSGAVCRPLGITSRTVIFCQGFTRLPNPYFSWVPFKPAKGEILTIECALDETRIVHRGGWLMPASVPGVFRAGSTYDWHDLSLLPTEPGRRTIEARLHALLKRPFRVVGHQAAIRPIIRESKALMGRHPVHGCLGFFNGLGSKGSLHAPFCALQFADSLTEHGEVEEELDLQKNFG